MAACRATKDRKYLDRAIALSEAVTATLGAKSAGLPGRRSRRARRWCGSTSGEDWSIDPDYNRDDRTNIFRPWGFQTGHQTEWTKLLLQLDRLCAEAGLAPAPARLARARALVRRGDALRLGRRARRPRLRLRARRHALRRRQVPLGAGREPGRRGVAGARRCSSRARRPPTWRTTGAGTTGSGTTPGPTSSTTDTGPGIASWPPTTRRSPTRRARRARWTTTTWARATTCWRRCAYLAGGDAAMSRHSARSEA